MRPPLRSLNLRNLFKTKFSQTKSLIYNHSPLLSFIYNSTPMASPVSAGPVADEENMPDLDAQQGSTSIALRHDRWRGFLRDHTTGPPHDEVQKVLLRLIHKIKKEPRYINWRLLDQLRSQFGRYALYKNRNPVELGSPGNNTSLSYDMLAAHWVVAAPRSASAASAPPTLSTVTPGRLNSRSTSAREGELARWIALTTDVVTASNRH